MVSLSPLHGDASTKGTIRWQKCDTDKLLLSDAYTKLTRTRQRQELLEQRQSQYQQRVQSSQSHRQQDQEMQQEDRR